MKKIKWNDKTIYIRWDDSRYMVVDRVVRMVYTPKDELEEYLYSIAPFIFYTNEEIVNDENILRKAKQIVRKYKERLMSIYDFINEFNDRGEVELEVDEE